MDLVNFFDQISRIATQRKESVYFSQEVNAQFLNEFWLTFASIQFLTHPGRWVKIFGCGCYFCQHGNQMFQGHHCLEGIPFFGMEDGIKSRSPESTRENSPLVIGSALFFNWVKRISTRMQAVFAIDENLPNLIYNWW